MQTRERFNGGLGPTVFSPSNERRIELARTLYSLSLSLPHLPWIQIYPRIIRPFALNACKFSDPDTHREIAAGGVGDVTWHGRHAYISRRENVRPDRQKWMSSSNGIFEKRKWKFTGLSRNDPSIFVRVNSAILVSITANGFDVVYSPAANCILATFYIENRHFYLYWIRMCTHAWRSR